LFSSNYFYILLRYFLPPTYLAYKATPLSTNTGIPEIQEIHCTGWRALNRGIKLEDCIFSFFTTITMSLFDLFGWQEALLSVMKNIPTPQRADNNSHCIISSVLIHLSSTKNHLIG
jgi:hypothetical protein